MDGVRPHRERMASTLSPVSRGHLLRLHLSSSAKSAAWSRAAGLGASLTVMPLWSVSLARRVLDLPLWVSPVAVIPIGWPIGRYGPTTRVPVGDAVHFDQHGNRPYRGMTADSLATGGGAV